MRGFRRRQRLWRDKAGGEEKNHIKRRVERQKVFSSPPAINQSSFITQPNKKALFQVSEQSFFVKDLTEFNFSNP